MRPFPLQTTYHFTNIDLAQFLVNTECLEATFDSFAAWGVGMNPNIFGMGPAPLGNPRKANLSPEIQPWVEEVRDAPRACIHLTCVL